MSIEKEYIQQIKVKSLSQHSEDEMFEMSNFYPADTGLSMSVWIMTKAEYKHKKPQMKFQDEDKMLYPISIEDEPVLLAKNANPKISSSDLNALKSWIVLNKDALLDHWEGRISTKGLVERLKSI